MEDYHIRSGRLGSCLLNNTPCTYIEASWITNLLIYLQKTKCIIHSTKIGILHSLRHHDQPLMEIFTDAQVNKKELRILNIVRTFLQITTISEIRNNSGTKIHPGCSDQTAPKRKITHTGNSTLNWPKQPPPTAKMWRVWLKHLKHA
jgi:hypothetical protein